MEEQDGNRTPPAEQLTGTPEPHPASGGTLRERALQRINDQTDAESAPGSGETEQQSGSAENEQGEYVAGPFDQVMSMTGAQLHRLAQTMRERTPEISSTDVAGRIAQSIDQSGEYLQAAHPQDLRRDLEQWVNSDPFRAFLISMLIGFILGRLTRK